MRPAGIACGVAMTGPPSPNLLPPPIANGTPSPSQERGPLFRPCVMSGIHNVGLNDPVRPDRLEGARVDRHLRVVGRPWRAGFELDDRHASVESLDDAV